MKTIMSFVILIFFPLSSFSYYNCTSKILTTPPNKNGATEVKVYSFNLFYYRSGGDKIIEGHLVARVITNSFLTERGVESCDAMVSDGYVWDGSCYPRYDYYKFSTEEIEVDGQPMVRYSAGSRNPYFLAPVQMGEGFKAEFYLNEYAEPFTMYCSHGDVG